MRDITNYKIENIICNICFTLCLTFHTSITATLAQLIFGQDMLFSTLFVANWYEICQRKENQMHYNNSRENRRRFQHKFQLGDSVLICNKKMADNTQLKIVAQGIKLCPIIKFYNNGNVLLQCKSFNKRINI